jgi:hypothetical protein
VKAAFQKLRAGNTPVRVHPEADAHQRFAIEFSRPAQIEFQPLRHLDASAVEMRRCIGCPANRRVEQWQGAEQREHAAKLHHRRIVREAAAALQIRRAHRLSVVSATARR